MGGVSATLVVATIIAAVGCSSSSTAAAPDAGHDSAAAGDSGSSADTGAAAHDSAASDAPSGDAAACPPASTAGYTPQPYVAAVGHQGVCSTGQIADFITACVTSTTQAPCTDWQNTNVPSEAGAGTPCGNCILAPNNNGGLWLDSLGNGEPNYAACIQLSDPVHGAACAAAYDDFSGCQAVACDAYCYGTAGPTCATNTACEGCLSGVGMGSCMSYYTAAHTACASDGADGGPFDTCSPGAALNSQTPDFSYIITLICGGSAPDGGADQ